MTLQLYKSVFSGMQSDVEDDYGLVDQNGCEIDYIKLTELQKLTILNINIFFRKNVYKL